MTSFQFYTVDVSIDPDFNGNQLVAFPKAESVGGSTVPVSRGEMEIPGV